MLQNEQSNKISYQHYLYTIIELSSVQGGKQEITKIQLTNYRPHDSCNP